MVPSTAAGGALPGRLRYVEKIVTARSQQYMENRSLHNAEFLQTFHNVEKLSQQFVEKVA